MSHPSAHASANDYSQELSRLLILVGDMNVAIRAYGWDLARRSSWETTPTTDEIVFLSSQMHNLGIIPKAILEGGMHSSGITNVEYACNDMLSMFRHDKTQTDIIKLFTDSKYASDTKDFIDESIQIFETIRIKARACF
jgi:hypothetical protein